LSGRGPAWGWSLVKRSPTDYGRRCVNEEAVTHCGLVAPKDRKETDKADTTIYCMKKEKCADP